MTEKKTSKQLQAEERSRVESRRFQELADKTKEDIMLSGGDTPSEDLVWRIVRHQGIEIDELQKFAASADVRPVFIQWWESCSVATRRMIVVLPFYVIIEAILHTTSGGNYGITETVIGAIVDYMQGK